MARAVVPFAEWTPDLAGPNGGLAVATNVLPTANGYAPVPAFVAETGVGALSGLVLGAGAFKGSSGLTELLAGTETHLYRRVATGWESLGSGYGASYLNPWQFVQFGDRVIASNGVDNPVWYDLANGGNVTTLAGAPKFLLSAIVLDFIVTAIVGGDVSLVQWSGINNSEEWRSGFGQSDFNIASSGGAITGLTGGEYGLVLQEERISRMRYVGGNVIFQFDPISREVGCITHRSVAQLGRLTFFLSARGFMMCDGLQVTPIGDQKVDKTFLDALDEGRLDRMSASIDPVRKLVAWTLPAENPSEIYVYSWALQRWSKIAQATRLLFSQRARDVTIGEDWTPDMPADGFIGDGAPFGDPKFRGGALSLGVFDGSNQIGGFSGANMAATLTPSETALSMGQAARLRLARPIADVASGVTLRLGGRLRMGDAFVETVHTGLRASGDIPVRREVRTARPSLEIAAGTTWTFAQGWELEFERGAGR